MSIQPVQAPCLISVIDDDPGMRMSLDGLLRSLGHHIALFESAEEFLASADGLESDCVISDVHMPGGMSGIDLVRHLAGSHPDMPVILMTGFSQEMHDAVPNEAGRLCFLQKPFDDETLIDCLRAALAP